MNYEELVESRKCIGDMSKEELFEYCQGLLEEVWDFEKENERLHFIIKEVRESIERGYVVFCEQDEQCLLNFRENILEILDKEDKEENNND